MMKIRGLVMDDLVDGYEGMIQQFHKYRKEFDPSREGEIKNKGKRKGEGGTTYVVHVGRG